MAAKKKLPLKSSTKKQPAEKRAAGKSARNTPKKAASGTRRKTPIKTAKAKRPVHKVSASGAAGKVDKTPEWITIHFVNESGRRIGFESNPRLQKIAMRWKYTLAKRQRWKSQSSDAVKKRAMDELLDLPGINGVEDFLEASRVVEVQIPYYREDVGWEGRVTPWEYMLNAVSKERYRTEPLTVIRSLQRVGKPQRSQPLSKEKVLYVQSAPGELSDCYDFSSEEKMVREALGVSPDILRNPSLAQLEAHIKQTNPDVIHLAGIDNHQAREILEDRGTLPGSWIQEGDDPWDGMVLAGPGNSLDPVSAHQLAKVLNAGRKPLTLVNANLYHSGPRICSLAVAEGAEFAIGFQDTIDDAIAELFFQEFCSVWTKQKRLDPLNAFIASVNAVRQLPKRLRGTGIVLWSGHSLCERTSEKDLQDASLRRLQVREKNIVLRDKDDHSWLTITIEPMDRLNYSLLHNQACGLFRTFKFHKQRDGTLKNVSIEVVLYVGTDSHPFTSTIDLVERTTDIEDRIHVPLTSELIRTVQEPLKTSVFVRITAGKVLLKQETYRVTLLPADEWKDDDAGRIWLPSFVLPRDPAVEQFMSRAQKHLVTLADDRTKGFDGYQSFDPDDPETMADIDMQVQAIWSAVVHDFGIRYINPPPSYTEFGQRLRTPTQVLRGGYGTCIDLALMLAACLEYVDIHPVIFLLEGHAFAGYWRNDGAHEDFIEGAQQVSKELMRDAVGTQGEHPSWILPSSSYPEILQLVNDDILYPLETVGFTTHGSFWEALEEGVDNLRSREEFHSLIDIYPARSQFITPLPIIE